jgi:hypothetical protein
MAKIQRISVILWVKADSPESAIRVAETRLKLAEWFCDDAPLVEGQGYPEGTLLFYKVHAQATPPTEQPVPQIAG